MDDRERICELGRRICDKGFAAANDGNISVRLDDSRILCTPTMTNKGEMQPADICTVDMDGEQISGIRKRSSEVLLHLEVYKRRPDVRAVVHCHPPHATAFAVAGEPIPQCVLPEVEIFLGEVPIAPYETPGRQAFSETIVPFVEHSHVIVLKNHGTVSYADNLEHAFWWTEILDHYCHILLHAKQLGRIQYIPADKCKELLEYKQEWGCTDLRIYGDEAGVNVCGHQAFRKHWSEAGVGQEAFQAHPDCATAADHLQTLAPSITLSEEQLERIAELVAERLLSQINPSDNR